MTARAVRADNRDIQPWPRDVSHEPQMTIGQVLERVKPQFPALTISKIRFLENEGLLSPWRNPAGYRKYSLADIERLRYILAEQRDSYRPLKVILEQLRALDAGHEVDRVPTARLVADRGKTQLPATDHVSVRQLCDLTGTSKSDIEQFVQLGLINPDLSGYFATRCVHVVNLILALRRQGIAPRNLRVVRNSAERTADLIDQSVESMRARGRAGDIERARAQSQELAELTADLQREFLRLAIDKLSQ